MRIHSCAPATLVPIAIFWLALAAPSARGAASDEAPPPPSPTLPPSSPAAPSPVPTPPAGPPTREVLLEERLLKMEEINQKLLDQVEALSSRVEEASKKADEATQRVATQAVDDDKKPNGPQGTIGRGTNSGAGGESTSSATGVPAESGSNVTGNRARGGQGTIGRTRDEEKPRNIKTTISNGLRWTSDDDEFQLVFHDLTQTEMRNFPGLGGTSPLKSSFFIPRQRWYFTGRATKNVEFYTVINRGYGSIDLLDAFITLSFDPRIRFRTGRTKTPTSYEYYQIAEGDLIAPERSLYTGNLSGNRQNGFMFLGQVLDKRAEYALGVFNGPRRSFQDFNNDKDLFAFFNVRPFQKNENLTALKYLNLGAEFDFGNENNPVQPSSLRTANDQSSAASGAVLGTLSPSWLTFNNDVIEYGNRAHWSGWLAWYYKSFNLLVQYDGGYQDYALSGRNTRTAVPTEGFFVQAYYFLTGEEISRRVDVKPLRNFAFKDGKLTGLGAVEVHSRISTLDLGRQVFTAGFADPNLWADRAYAVDTGMNWYLNQYTKVYLDWQHAGFSSPIYNGINSHGQTNQTRSTDLLWLRFQLFF